jgi:HAD superfamily hydrolase (TIGR01509 family)
MQQLKAIIFDVDGTLANTEETHRQAFNAAFNEFGLEIVWSKQEYSKLLAISGGKERIYAYLKKQDVNPEIDQDLREYALTIHQRKSEIYREKLVAGHIGLRNGVARLLDEANSKGVKLGIATCTSKSNVETLLMNALGKDAMSRFSAVVTSDIIIDKKPSPVVYQFALAQLGLSPDVCVVIEDTCNGNRAALATGLQTVITTHAFTINDDFKGAQLILDQLGEPDQPFSAIAGNVHGAHYVDTALLEKIVSASVAHAGIEIWEEPTLAVAVK